MIGDQKLKTVMDMMLNDKVYFSLFALIQRYHNFQKTCDGINLNIHAQQKGPVTADFWPDYMSISYQENKYSYRNGILSLGQCFTRHPTNRLSVNMIEIYSNATCCDTCPVRVYGLEEKEYEIGWYCRDSQLDAEAESELFMHSTIMDTYTAEELNEIMNRMRNLPLYDNDSLTIEPQMCYYPSYKCLDELLWGY
jgi:hypothetical protein